MASNKAKLNGKVCVSFSTNPRRGGKGAQRKSNKKIELNRASSHSWSYLTTTNRNSGRALEKPAHRAEQFRERLKEEQKRDGRPPYTYPHLAKRFDGINDAGVFSLWNECTAGGVRSVGAMLTWKLKQIA